MENPFELKKKETGPSRQLTLPKPVEILYWTKSNTENGVLQKGFFSQKIEGKQFIDAAVKSTKIQDIIIFVTCVSSRHICEQ